MRTTFLALLAANVLFLAWARWIDTPAESGRQDALSRLPRLMLVSETAQSAPKPQSASAQKMAFREPEIPVTCTSVGPFNDIASTARAAALLLARGLAPRQRVEEGETVEGYWVYVGGMRTEDEVTRVVERLEKSGFTDARVMKESADGRRVSVGLFSKRERAERRALAVKHMGLDPEITERTFPGTVYWVDVALREPAQLPTEVLVSDGETAKVRTETCPPGVTTPAIGPQPIDARENKGSEDTTSLPRTKVASAPGVP